jgi:hypothetical protein
MNLFHSETCVDGFDRHTLQLRKHLTNQIIRDASAFDPPLCLLLSCNCQPGHQAFEIKAWRSSCFYDQSRNLYSSVVIFNKTMDEDPLRWGKGPCCARLVQNCALSCVCATKDRRKQGPCFVAFVRPDGLTRPVSDSAVSVEIRRPQEVPKKHLSRNEALCGEVDSFLIQSYAEKQTWTNLLS